MIFAVILFIFIIGILTFMYLVIPSNFYKSIENELSKEDLLLLQNKEFRL